MWNQCISIAFAVIFTAHTLQRATFDPWFVLFTNMNRELTSKKINLREKITGKKKEKRIYYFSFFRPQRGGGGVGRGRFGPPGSDTVHTTGVAKGGTRGPWLPCWSASKKEEKEKKKKKKKGKRNSFCVSIAVYWTSLLRWMKEHWTIVVIIVVALLVGLVLGLIALGLGRRTGEPPEPTTEPPKGNCVVWRKIKRGGGDLLIIL